MIWLVAIAALLAGTLLLFGGRRIRSRRGLGAGRTLELDDRNLYSARLGLVGRPDRLVRDGRFTIPEKWKSLSVYDSHRAQVGAYLILIEEETGIRPTHGFVVTGDGRKEMVENTPALRAWVLGVAEQIRAARRELDREIPVSQPPGKCRGARCGRGVGRDRDESLGPQIDCDRL
jgi:CRISPR-associated exonuclease Cas4